MAKFIFLVGRPGSGKSTLARAIAKEYHQGKELVVINDYPILWEMFEEECKKDPLKRRQFRERWQGGVRGFDVLDRGPVFRAALRRMNERLSPCLNTDWLILVEFSRNDYSDVSSSFSPIVLMNAHFVFLDAPLEVCIQRIQSRVMDQRYLDDCLVSEETMRRNHQSNGLTSLCAHFPRERIEVIQNGGAWENTWRKASVFLDTLLLQDEWSQARLQVAGPLFGRRQWTFFPL